MTPEYLRQLASRHSVAGYFSAVTKVSHAMRERATDGYYDCMVAVEEELIPHVVEFFRANGYTVSTPTRSHVKISWGEA